jgi:hypothetical protein
MTTRAPHAMTGPGFEDLNHRAAAWGAALTAM